MSRISVLPRDLKPGDKIDRMDKDMNVVQATISRVQKVRKMNRTAYMVFTVERDDLPENQRTWSENRHLVPFTLQPTSKITVERGEV